MKQLVEYWRILDLFGPDHLSWRDYSLVIFVVSLLVWIIVFIRKYKQRENNDLELLLLTFYGAFVIASIPATMKYKEIQTRLDIGYIYEQAGDYKAAFDVYYELDKEVGNYQDLAERILRCKEHLSNEN